MPRDPKDTSLSADQRIQRRIAEAADLREPAFLRSGGGATGAEGPEGPAGKNGAKWWAAAGVPGAGLGVTGDFYLDTTTDDVYEKKEGGWSLVANFQGEKGEKGATGTAGTNGTNGTNGKEGPAGSLENTDWKNSVRVATTANIATATALNPGDVLDGITLAENDRVLVKNQTTKTQNGIYIVAAVPSRALDADTAGDLSGGSTVFVEQGTKNARRNFQISTVGPITPGTTAHDWAAIDTKDFGLVTTLPTAEALEGDKCTFKAKAGEVVWDCIYDGSGEHPWKVIGGGPLFNEVTAQEATTSTTFTGLTTAGPSITTPAIKGVYMLELGFYAVQSGGTGAIALRMSYKIGATAAAEEDKMSIVVAAAGIGSAPGTRPREKTIAASTALLAQYNVSGGTGEFLNRWMRLTPIRIG